jgi:hypothetical protein
MQEKPLRVQAAQSDTLIRPSSRTWCRGRLAGVVGVGGGVESRFARR